MYTLVLMSALGGSPDSAQFNGFFRDLFSFRGGCRGTDDRSISRDTGGCSCSGGGLFHGGIRNWLSGGSCTGCCGGTGRAVSPARAGGGACNGRTGYDNMAAADRGYSCSGGGCTGYQSSPAYSNSCFGSCMGSTGMGGFGAPGIPGGFDTPGTIPPTTIPDDLAPPRSTPSYFGGESYPIGPPIIISPPSGFDIYPMDPPTINPPSVGEERGSLSVGRATGSSNQRGTVLVKLPPDAKLFAEGRRLTQTAGERKFVTPPLPRDREAVYTFRVEYVRDGRVLSESQKVQVKAGGTATVEFADLTTARPNTKTPDSYATGTASKKVPTIAPPATDVQPLLPPVTGKPPVPQDRAKIVVKLPEGATLYVDGRRNTRSESVREFTTPKLSAGKEYAYTMKAEWRRNGRPEMQEQRIEFRGGEQLTVDFTTGPNGTQRASR